MTYLNNALTDICETSPGRTFALREDDGLEEAIDRLTLSLAGHDLAELPEERLICDQHEAFKGAPGLIDTARLRSLLPAFISQLYAMFSANGVQRGAASRLRELRQMLRALFKAEKQNYTASLTHAVISNPELQSQIREDLGGDAALKRWEIRRDKRDRKLSGAEKTRPRIQTSLQKTSLNQRSRRDASRILTDRTGLFCLASLRRQAAPRTQSSHTSFSIPAANTSLRAPAPIGLTAEQLRRPKLATSATPPIPQDNIIGLQKIWDDMQSEHYYWDLLLMIAGLMTFSGPVRDAFAPP